MATPIDAVRKIRPETEFKLQDVDHVRHMTIDAFAMPMAIMTLSYLFETTNKHAVIVDFNTGVASTVLGINAVIVASMFFVLYLLRAIMHPQKVRKEWQHPVLSNSFSCLIIARFARRDADARSWCLLVATGEMGSDFVG